MWGEKKIKNQAPTKQKNKQIIKHTKKETPKTPKDLQQDRNPNFCVSALTPLFWNTAV